MNAMIERKYCSISTSYLAGLFDIFDIKSHLTELCVFWWMFTNEDADCDAYYNEFESDLRSTLDIFWLALRNIEQMKQANVSK